MDFGPLDLNTEMLDIIKKGIILTTIVEKAFMRHVPNNEIADIKPQQKDTNLSNQAKQNKKKRFQKKANLYNP